MKLYSVINIDIVNSRNILNRNVFQEQFKDYLEKLSEEYQSILVAPITLTLGDEWQIVMNDIRESYNICVKIRNYLNLSSIKCYCGIGIGTISTNEATDTRKMDGEAFIYAREGLNSIKSNKKAYKKDFPTKDCRVFLQGPGSKLTRSLDNNVNIPTVTYIDIINNIIQNNETHLCRVTEKQQETIDLYEELGTYNAINNKVPNLSKGMISDRLRTSNYKLMKANRALIYNLLQEYWYYLKGG